MDNKDKEDLPLNYVSGFDVDEHLGRSPHWASIDQARDLGQLIFDDPEGEVADTELKPNPALDAMFEDLLKED